MNEQLCAVARPAAPQRQQQRARQTSGPLTILGSLPFSILPIWRAISVLPVPAGGRGGAGAGAGRGQGWAAPAALGHPASSRGRSCRPPASLAAPAGSAPCSTTQRTRGAVQQHAAHVADAQPLHHSGREDARGKGAAEDLLKLVVQAADAQLLKVELLVLEELRCVGVRRAGLHRAGLRRRVRPPGDCRRRARWADACRPGGTRHRMRRSSTGSGRQPSHRPSRAAPACSPPRAGP